VVFRRSVERRRAWQGGRLTPMPVPRRRARAGLAAAVPILLCLLLAPSARGALGYTPCSASPAFSCAALAVPLDRSGASAGTISLSIERLASGATQSRDAVLALAGGPGQAVLPLAPYVAQAIAPALGGHDLILFDQRGTGASGALACPALSGQGEGSHVGAGQLVERCARQIGPARGAYTTRESVEDIESIRRAAGYERLVLYGTSYGTKVALRYAERYPQHVESLVLDSPELAEGPEPFHVSTFRAMRPMLRELCSRGACARISGNPLGDLAHLAERLSAHPLTGHAIDGRGRSISVPLTSREVFYLLLAGDLNPAIRAEVPAAVRAAVTGDSAPLSRLITLLSIHPASEASGEIDFTLFVDTSCEETPFPWQRSAPEATRAVEAEAALNALPSSDFYPFDPESGLFDQTIPLCVSWPDAAPAPAPAGVLPNVPTLVLSGGQDLRTPTDDARRIVGMIPDAQLLRVPFTGHSVLGSDLSGCAKAAVAAFFAAVPVQACGAVADLFPPAAPAPSALSRVAPLPRIAGARGRTAAGIVASLRDLRRATLILGFDFGTIPYGARFGGLRGGTVTMTAAGAALNHYSYVRGLQLTGLVGTGILLKDRGSSASLAVGGSSATAGRVRIAAGGRLSGTLAGRPFHVAGVRIARARGGPTATPAIPATPLARVP
jgi:pimeloyl-ACP methyl ester carboxylesterase